MTVLLLDNDPNRRKVIVEALERFGPAFEIEAAAPGSEVMRRLSGDGYDVILDCGQPEKDRLAMLRNIQRRGQLTQVIVVTDEGGEEEARRAMQEGASDYIVRTEAYLTTLPLVVEKAYQRRRLLAELRQLRGGEQSPELAEGPKLAHPLAPQDETITTLELPSDSNEALRDALARMQKALEEANVLLEKSQIRFDNQASALEQAIAEVCQQARDMSALNAIADIISRSSVLDEVLSNALDKVLEATETRMGAVLVLDQEAKKIVIASQRGLSEEFAQAITDVKTRERTFLWKILSGNSLLVDGTSSGSESCGLSKEMKKEGVGSLLGVPLSSKGKVRGAMIIAADEEGHLTSHDADFLIIVGRQTGLAIENIELREEIGRASEEWPAEIAEGGEANIRPVDERRPEFIEGTGGLEHLTQAALEIEIEDEVQRQNRELWTINAVAEAVSQSFDLDEILSNVVSKLTAVMGIEASWVYLVEAQEEKEPELLLKAHRGVSERFARGMTRVRMGEGLDGQVASSGEPLLIEDLIESDVKTRLVVEQEGLRSFAGVPMKAKDRVIGVIAVASHIPRPFAPHEVRLLISISNQVGIAVEKVQLYHQVKGYAEQQEKSNQVLQEINSMLMESQAELEELNRLKSDFIAIVSHELRTPLASIIGYVDLMLDEETGPRNEEQSQYLGVIERNAERLSRLINNILDISRIEAGHIDLAMVPLDVVEIAKETVVTMQPQAQAKGIEMTVSMAEGLPLIQGDPDRIRQVLVNVLGNAIKFTPQGGRVEIGGRCLVAGEQPPPPGPELATASDWLLVSVTDTGVGIATEELDRIFDKFYQVGGFADRSGEGSGLGLSIARGIVEAHGGLIWAQSAGENQGSTFTFALPVIAAPIKRRPEFIEGPIFEAPASRASTAVILVVDDDPDAVNLLRLYLEAKSYSVTGAHDGETALQLAVELQPAVILLDLLMPELDGFAVLEKLKANTATQDIPVVIVSILADQEKGLSLGAVDYLTKPIDRQRLLKSVRTLTRTKSFKGTFPSVLIVDDDKELVDLLRIHLLGGGFWAICAYNGREAIEKVRGQIPDLIILDILMPEMDGFEVIEALKGNPLTHHIPVIILTAKDLTEKEREALQLGTTRYLTKTLFSKEDLLAEVRDMVGMLTENWKEAEETNKQSERS